VSVAGAELIPVVVLSGFLGSGKTSLLRVVLRGAADTAVIVNEFGAIGLDHQLLRASEERVELVGGGCACCTRREDLVRTLRDLLDDRDRGRAELRRVVIETSGLADPAPIVFTITNDPMLRHHFRIERLVVTVDAVNGIEQLAAHPEVAKQVLVADELVITKVDLVGAEVREGLTAALASLNPAATIGTAIHGLIANEPLRPAPGAATVGPAVAAPGAIASQGAPGHTDDVRTLRVSADDPLDWLGFAVWLSMLLHAHGEAVLRVKGLLELDDGTLVSVNGVQHVVHMPEHLPPGAIPDAPGGIVFITRGVDPDRLRESLETFQRLARSYGSLAGPLSGAGVPVRTASVTRSAAAAAGPGPCAPPR
jgi:G3E family GTPase